MRTTLTISKGCPTGSYNEQTSIQTNVEVEVPSQGEKNAIPVGYHRPYQQSSLLASLLSSFFLPFSPSIVISRKREDRKTWSAVKREVRVRGRIKLKSQKLLYGYLIRQLYWIKAGEIVLQCIYGEFECQHDTRNCSAAKFNNQWIVK